MLQKFFVLTKPAARLTSVVAGKANHPLEGGVMPQIVLSNWPIKQDQNLLIDHIRLGRGKDIPTDAW